MPSPRPGDPLGGAGARLCSLALALAAAGGGTLGCGGGTAGSGADPAPAPPIVLISVDTLRSDRLPAYGYEDGETPAIDRLRSDSILFKYAYSPSPLTLPAHASMLSGLLPPEHGVRDNVGYRYDAATVPHLPAILRRRGYDTAATVSSFVLRGISGLGEDFDLYDDQIAAAGLAEDVGSAQRSGDLTLERAREWLRSRDPSSERPFFLFFHLYEPHTPYDPPEPWASRHRSAYDGEVAAADAYVGGLLDELERLGHYDPALIVFTSDHGESLGEHDYLEHGPFLYREAIQVPLLIKLPGGRRGGETVTAPAQLTDLTPTVLDLLGEPIPKEIGGASLLTLGAEPRRLFAETVYPRLHFGWSDLASIIEYPHHYIHGPDPELYDLATDPGELNNLLSERRSIATKLRRELDRYDRSLEAPGEEDLETTRRLAALGYVTSSVIDGDGDDGGPLPDPKARVHILGEMAQAVLAARAGNHPEAVAIYRRVLVEEPRMIEAWQYLGASLMALERPAEATEAYLEAVRLSGGAAHLALPAASALLAVGRLDEARAHAELAAPIHPSAHDLMAQIALAQGDLDEAERQLDAVLAAGGRRVGPYITRAELLLRRQRYSEAVAATRTAEENLGDGPERFLRGLFLIRGDALAALDNLAAAREAYAREIRIHPTGVTAYARLAFAQAVAGDGPGAGATLRSLVETNPRPDAYAAAVTVLRRMGDERAAAAVLRQALTRWPADEGLRSLNRG